MSMVAVYRRVSPERLDALIQEPETVWELIQEEEEGTVPEDELLSIDKAWHGLHYLLNGDPWAGQWPLYDAIMGGERLGNEDVGYGPARYLTPAQVADIAEVLSVIRPDELEGRYDAEAMTTAEIYPGIWEQEDALDYLLSHYANLVQFFLEAAGREEAVIMIVY